MDLGVRLRHRELSSNLALVYVPDRRVLTSRVRSQSTVLEHVRALEACDANTLAALTRYVSSALIIDDASSMREEERKFNLEHVAGVSAVFVEATRRGFDASDVKSTLERDCGTSSERAKIIADAYGAVRAEIERRLKSHASSSTVGRVKSHACRADYVVSTSANSDSREKSFHVSWVLNNPATGADDRIDFACDMEEMMHLVETLREACRASETIAARSSA